jgi:hypothetical protein
MGVIDDARQYGIAGVFSRRKRRARERDEELPPVDEIGAGSIAP